MITTVPPMKADDVLIIVRVASENLVAFTRGVEGNFTEIKLVPAGDGSYGLLIEGFGEVPLPEQDLAV